MFTRSRLNAGNANQVADFMNDLQANHWSLTSRGFEKRPDSLPPTTGTDLLEGERQKSRLGTFLLRQGRVVISMVQVDELVDHGRVAVFSGAETHPQHQRRGTFWRQLGIPCVRVFSMSSFDRLAALTWTFNRKGIPVYKRFGFRAVPGTSLLLDNYLPTIIRHPATRSFFQKYDFLRRLENTRSYGFDGIDDDGLMVFEYRWQKGDDRLEVMVDWERHRIVRITRADWSISCFAALEDPFCVHYSVENSSGSSLCYCIHTRNGHEGTSRLQALLPGSTHEGDMYISDTPHHTAEGASVVFEVNGEKVPFHPRRYRARCEQSTRVCESAEPMLVGRRA